jgi:transposase InsO family protein
VEDQPALGLAAVHRPVERLERKGHVFLLAVGPAQNFAAELVHHHREVPVDRDAKFTDQFRRLIGSNGTQVIRLRPMSPNLNAYAERFVRSIKEECLDRMIFVGQASLRRAVSEYMAHYHAERNHQGLGNRLIDGNLISAANHGQIHRRERLGGMLNFYYCSAA